jgi:ABC-type branched-subunit amino acid transport system substrate-binding protein
MNRTVPNRHTAGRTTRAIAAAATCSLLLAGCGMRVPDEPTAVAQQSAPVAAAPVSNTVAAPAAPAAPSGGAAPTAAAAPVAGVAAKPAAAQAVTAAVAAPAAANSASIKTAARTETKAAASTTSASSHDVTIAGPDTQGVSASSIKVGVLAPISGAAGFLGQNEVDGLNAYFSDTNANGGVKGRSFKTVVVDTAFDPASEATGARQLVEQDKVFAMIGVLGDSEAPYVTSVGIPNVVLGITPPAYSSRYPTTYPVTLNTVQSVIAMADYFKRYKKAPINSVGILYDTQNMNVKPWLKYMEQGWTAQGVKVASSDAFNLSDANCDQIVTKVRDEKIDFWQAGESLGWPICLASAARQNYSPPFGIGGPYSADSKFVGGAGKGSDGVYAQMNGVQIRINTGQPYPASPDNRAPEVDNYIRTMKTYSPNSADMGSLENIWTQDSWSMAKLIVEAVSHQTQSVTWKGVNQYIQGMDHWVSGLVQPVDFRPDCKTGSEPWVFQWKRQPDGTLVESDWKPFGGMIDVPTAIKNALVPGAGACYVSRMADAGLR